MDPSSCLLYTSLVAADEKTIYHAGDLNWWHWEGEEPAWNRDMEVRFQRYLEPLRRRHIDLAMVPLDPRPVSYTHLTRGSSALS